MVLSNVGDKNFVVNSLSNFVIEKLGVESSSVIKVVDLKNFFVIKGKTDSKDILNLNDLISEYSSKYSQYLESIKITNTIDLIEYDCTVEEVKKLTLTLHNTEKCDFHYKQIESFKETNKSNDFSYVVQEVSQDELIYQSVFPHGYSLNQGKLLYYYIKKLFYKIPSNYPITTITITIDETLEGDDYIDVYNNFFNSNDETIKSAILDCIDFTKSQVESEIKKVDCNFELLNPLEELPYLLGGKKLMII